jgi:hypothetical protein
MGEELFGEGVVEEGCLSKRSDARGKYQDNRMERTTDSLGLRPTSTKRRHRAQTFRSDRFSCSPSLDA